VIGYVYTEYRKRSLSAVKADVERFFRLYPDIAGIFVDQISNDTAPAVKSYYRKLYDHVKARSPTALVIGNPGAAATTPWQVEDPVVADVLVVFEGPAAEYRKWSPPDWVRSRPAETFGHLVYKSRRRAATEAICAASQRKHAGWIYVTRGLMDNPWDVPPEPAMYACPSLQRRSVVEA
jgi:Spherulation-specific family 4